MDSQDIQEQDRHFLRPWALLALPLLDTNNQCPTRFARLAHSLLAMSSACAGLRGFLVLLASASMVDAFVAPSSGNIRRAFATAASHR